VDSERKHGQDDSIIPANVAEAVNFYQDKGIIHGRAKIVAANPSRTAILGNFNFIIEKNLARAVSTRGMTGCSSRVTPPLSAIHAFGRKFRTL